MLTLIDSNIKSMGLIVGQSNIQNLLNKKNRNNKLDKLIKQLETEVKTNPNTFISKPTITAYNEFFKNIKSVIDSTDPAPKILIDLILKYGHLPTISRVVDCMNYISIKHGVTISIWDQNNIKGDIVYKNSQGEENYWPFMGDEVKLLKDELAAYDSEKVLCLVRFRDSKYAPVNVDTTNIIIHIQGVGGIDQETIRLALNDLNSLIIENCGGNLIEKSVLV